VNILLVTQAFPPYNTSGAVRVGKLAAFLVSGGHDVRVLTARPLPYPESLPMPVAERAVIWTRSADPLVLLQRLRRSQPPADTASRSAAGRTGLAQRIVTMAAPLAIPEPQVGWYGSAVAAGRRLLRGWRPDAIYASALPFTAHLVAASLARDAKVPWIAEFRDHFAGNPYSNLPGWRAPIDRWLERRVVRSAAACVTVSEPMAETLRNRHRKPAIVVLNGYDSADQQMASVPGADDNRTLRIVYTGLIYPGRRDPSVLFAAVQSLGQLTDRVHVTFYGQDLRGVTDSAQRHGIAANVQVCSAIPYRESLSVQRRADVLLLLLWNDPREAGVFTGKLFEYVGAARPILAVGAESGVAANLIRSRGLGVAVADAQQIAVALRRWIAEKERDGQVAAPPESARIGLSRREQFEHVDALLRNVVGGNAGDPLRTALRVDPAVEGIRR
jgi:glycosyltransferase involved in cell wall biosynthesis